MTKATTVDIEAVKHALVKLELWAHKCHQASLTIVQSGLLGPARVARGVCMGVGAQHSWVVLGHDCYDDDATIVDPTLWSYDSRVDGIWVGSYRDELHIPFGRGQIWTWGRPHEATKKPVELTPRKPFSEEAREFLWMIGPLDEDGWRVLGHAPVEGWPAGEIIDAMCETPHPSIPGLTMEGMVPIDIVGMVTDRNPKGLYLP